VTYLIGIDGGGTRTTLALADHDGREILRRTGPAGLVDPRSPAATAEMLIDLAREAIAASGVNGPAAALCAGLAGVGNRTEREIVEMVLARSGIAEKISIRPDGEIALAGAFGGGPGILLIAGTGSVAFGRGEDGRTERCGGWGMVLGDEGSGYSIGRAAVRAALRSVDGRGAETRLLPVLLDVLGMAVPEALPPWAGRADKSEIAALAVYAVRLADEGDKVATDLVRTAARDLAGHAAALVRTLGPWGGPVPAAAHGGLARDPTFARHLHDALDGLAPRVEVREPESDAVAGAVRFARGIVKHEA
jgi:glucosamine kinase